VSWQVRSRSALESSHLPIIVLNVSFEVIERWERACDAPTTAVRASKAFSMLLRQTILRYSHRRRHGDDSAQRTQLQSTAHDDGLHEKKLKCVIFPAAFPEPASAGPCRTPRTADYQQQADPSRRACRPMPTRDAGIAPHFPFSSAPREPLAH